MARGERSSEEALGKKEEELELRQARFAFRSSSPEWRRAARLIRAEAQTSDAFGFSKNTLQGVRGMSKLW